jgi:hypothetical protein
MQVIILKSLVGLGKSFKARQLVDLPEEVAAEWCRIGYAKSASPVAAPKEQATSKIQPEVRTHANPGISSGGDQSHPGTSQPTRGKKPSKS